MSLLKGPEHVTRPRARTFERVVLPRFIPLAQRLVAIPLAVDPAASGPSQSRLRLDLRRAIGTVRPHVGCRVVTDRAISSTIWLSCTAKRCRHPITPHQLVPAIHVDAGSCSRNGGLPCFLRPTLRPYPSGNAWPAMVLPFPRGVYAFLDPRVVVTAVAAVIGHRHAPEVRR